MRNCSSSRVSLIRLYSSSKQFKKYCMNPNAKSLALPASRSILHQHVAPESLILQIRVGRRIVAFLIGGIMLVVEGAEQCVCWI
ncbi:hypothetical protein LWI29_015817 [Acer saccharum]|uniref:Uncharacterized protein n=1 Tax=Acer saccharum TaxID=4024 RepID=A0AA39VZ46_ACESA|nr:hypothetical protein LWI29_015817 [Acer saccharum]